MTNPKATLHMANGADIVIELLPEAAPNSKQLYLRCFPRLLRPSRHRTYRSG
jgi:hypothetical protein